MRFFPGIFLIFNLLLSSATPALADDDSWWGFNAVNAVYTDYVFRGKTVYEGTNMQPSVTGYFDFEEFGTLSTNVWLFTSLESNEPPEKFTEIDYTISYDVDISMFRLTAGHIFYTFPSGDETRIADTVEYFLGISADTFLSPSFTFFNDYDEGRYQYYTLGLSHSFAIEELGSENDITPYVTFGFASNADDGPVFYFDNGLVHVDLGVTMDVPVGIFYLTPEFNFTFENDDAANNEFWAGISISYTA